MTHVEAANPPWATAIHQWQPYFTPMLFLRYNSRVWHPTFICNFTALWKASSEEKPRYRVCYTYNCVPNKYNRSIGIGCATRLIVCQINTNCNDLWELSFNCFASLRNQSNATERVRSVTGCFIIAAFIVMCAKSRRWCATVQRFGSSTRHAAVFRKKTHLN